HKIMVGGPKKLYFDPQVVMGAVGDIIHFEFSGKNHTVTESSYDKPCDKFEGGLDNTGKFEFTIKDKNPRWFFCKTGHHCGAGML
ncbi:hypothetical protein L873DRAFT_1619868, partial [Choiromyces venosus 120613-1]